MHASNPTSNGGHQDNGGRGTAGGLRPFDRYVRHAERFGVELVFETAAGLGGDDAELTVAELVELARRCDFNPARPDKLVELAAGEVRGAYLERIRPVLDAFAAPPPSRADRCCEWCGRSVAGRADRRTCSAACRKRLARAGGIGAFSRPAVTVVGGDDLGVGPRGFVTPMPRKQRGFATENRGVGDFREVGPGVLV